MNLLFRLFLTLFLARKKKAGPLDVVRTRSRVFPNDLDFNRHVNNGRVLSIADLGRLDWFLRTGCLRVAVQNKWLPIVGDATVRFIKPLLLWDAFTIESRALGWGAKWGFMEHRIYRAGGQLAVIVVIRGMFWSRKDGPISLGRLMAASGLEAESPELPAWVQTWSDALDQLSQVNSRQGS